MKTNLWVMFLTTATAFTALTSTANAQCSSMSTPKAAVAWMYDPSPAQTEKAPTAYAKAQPLAHGTDPSIVGLWKTTFFSGKDVVDQAFEVFHGDGTEMMVDTAPPASDNVCVGVWVQTSGLAVKLNHPSWTFDDKGNLNGTATIRMDITLDPNSNSFTGAFIVDVFDLAGNNLVHLVGTVTGKRVTVD
jgi:hypothetical protein